MEKKWNDQIPHGLTKKRPRKYKIFFLQKKYFFLAAVAADRVQGKDTHGKKGTKVTLAAAAQKKL